MGSAAAAKQPPPFLPQLQPPPALPTLNAASTASAATPNFNSNIPLLIPSSGQTGQTSPASPVGQKPLTPSPPSPLHQQPAFLQSPPVPILGTGPPAGVFGAAAGVQIRPTLGTGPPAGTTGAAAGSQPLPILGTGPPAGVTGAVAGSQPPPILVTGPPAGVTGAVAGAGVTTLQAPPVVASTAAFVGVPIIPPKRAGRPTPASDGFDASSKQAAAPIGHPATAPLPVWGLQAPSALLPDLAPGVLSFHFLLTNECHL